MGPGAMMVAGLLAAAAGWVFPQFQHYLYTEQEFRARPATGKKLLALRVFCAIAAGAGVALAFRDDHYRAGPALVTGVFILVLVTVSSTDFDRRRIPNKMTYPAVIAGLAFSWVWPDRTVAEVLIGTGVGLGIGIVLVAFGALAGRSGGMGLGIGDAKLMVLMGVLLGWPSVLSGLLYGVLLGGGVAVALLVTKGRTATFAYGPYLAAACAALLLFLP